MGNGDIIKWPWCAAGVLKSAEGRGTLIPQPVKQELLLLLFPVLSVASRDCSNVIQSPCLSEPDPDQ